MTRVSHVGAPGLQEGPPVKSLDTTAQESFPGGSILCVLSHTVAGGNCAVRMTPLAEDLEAPAWSLLDLPYIGSFCLADFNLYPFSVSNHTTMTTSIKAFLSSVHLRSQALSLRVLLGTPDDMGSKKQNKEPLVGCCGPLDQGVAA